MFECFRKKKPRISDIPARPVVTPSGHSTYPDHYLETALEITGNFEGTGFNNITGNFDKQGISAGILQWNYGQGSLQEKILKPLISQFGSDSINRLFPSPISESAYMRPKKAIRFAKRKMLDGKDLKPDWRRAWKKFLISPEVILQQKKAADSVASKAWHYCEKYEIKSKKSFCFFFDIVTQNGSLKGVGKPDGGHEYFDYLIRDGGINRKTWKDIYDLDLESKILFIWTCKRVTRNKWASDVIARKGIIAHGIGHAHEEDYNLVDKLK